jgi:putative aldouronate transport system permease protein
MVIKESRARKETRRRNETRRRTVVYSTPGERLFSVFIAGYVAFCFIIIAYPLYFILLASFSNPTAVSAGTVWLFPKGFNLEGYKAILAYNRIWIGYRNTVFYTVVGTLISLVVTLPAAYALSRKDFMPRRLLIFMFTFTMFFSGGLIPTYLLISRLNMNNRIWVMLIPFCLNVYNMIIARSFFETSIPAELHEAAIIDGCGDGRFFFSVVLPLSKPIIAVVALYYAVATWNNYFRPMIYIKNNAIQVLQVFLRDILIQNQLLETMSSESLDTLQSLADAIKYGIIIISALPMIIIYPFIQRYFVKGVMIGAVKG